MVLAVKASQIASREKNVANAFVAADDRSFSAMYANRSNVLSGSSSANSQHASIAVNTTLMGAQIARFV
jgi:hypothetical protein